jgi:hypothetical protein
MCLAKQSVNSLRIDVVQSPLLTYLSLAYKRVVKTNNFTVNIGLRIMNRVLKLKWSDYFEVLYWILLAGFTRVESRLETVKD